MNNLTESVRMLLNGNKDGGGECSDIKSFRSIMNAIVSAYLPGKSAVRCALHNGVFLTLNEENGRLRMVIERQVQNTREAGPSSSKRMRPDTETTETINSHSPSVTIQETFIEDAFHSPIVTTLKALRAYPKRN